MTPAERISEHGDYHIYPIVKVLATVFISDFLRRLEELGHQPEVTIFCHVDFLSPYTSQGGLGVYEESFD